MIFFVTSQADKYENKVTWVSGRRTLISSIMKVKTRHSNERPKKC